MNHLLLLLSSTFSAGSLILLVLACVVILIGIWLILTYRRLTQTRIHIDSSWNQVSVQLKMRVDLIPGLIRAVEGQARHEQETISKVMETRSRCMSARTSEQTIQCSGEMGNWINRLLAITERYPNLKADDHFQQLQQQLTAIEQKIALARQFYNDAVMQYNRYVLQFPGKIVASLFGFAFRPFFEYTAKEADHTVQRS